MGKFKLHSYCYKEMDYEIKESTSYTIYVTSKKCILDGLSKKTMCLGEVVIPLKDGKRGLFINGAIE